MRALFIGGTGNISLDITRLCLSLGWEVTLLNRGRTDAAAVPDAELLRADIRDEAGVAALLTGRSFDVAANFIAFTPEEIERDLRLFAGKTGQYIFISTAAAYQRPPSRVLIREDTPLINPHWAYARDKIACETRLMDAYRRDGFPVTIVRPSHTYSVKKIPVGLYGASAWQVIKRMQAGKPVLVQGDGTALWTMTHSRDFARGFAGLMGNPHALGEAVHITSDEALTWNQVYETIGRVLGVAPKLCHVSADFIAACDPAFAGRLLGDKSACAVFDNSKIKRLSPGFCAGIRYDEGVRWSIDYALARAELQEEDKAFDRFTDAIVDAQEKAAEWVKKQKSCAG